MIKVNKRFEFERDKYQWLLYEWSMGVSVKTKKPISVKRTTYHGNLDQICKTILDRSAGDCKSMKELQDLFSHAVEILTDHIKSKEK